ncbi:flagellar hook protein FlgE [Parachitinimonas caeni]|uniref:Flagellar hook protein FlgE n=1 Tax=Parachitinimonas caeni TaxID=3031301 RepID=A0ABT7DUI5_9NEIS|nr:flagellar hook-basal body complex protein [Parachitinimonas caeni]MDK2123740.1 flagellar hook-basal body complex protein [Parachitinimonas caeni]
MGFQQGLSGLNSATKFLDVVGNNVANANTVGFKGSRAEFADIYANTLASTSVQTGIGGRATNVAQQFSQGNITTTNNPLDLAITGNGFYQLKDAAGSVSYTRNGQFQLDRFGYIVNNGLKLTGYSANSDGQLITGNTPTEIKIQTANIGARATGGSSQANAGLTLGMNLDARAAIVNRGTSTVSVNGMNLDNNDGEGTAYTVTTRIADTMGAFHKVDVRVTKTSTPNTWAVDTSIDGGPFLAASAPLVFNTNGQLVTGNPATVSTKITAPSGAQTPLQFQVNFAGLTGNSTGSVAGTATTNDKAAQYTTVQIANANLDASNPNSTARTFTTNVLAPDGTSHKVDVTLTKTATNTWQIDTAWDGGAATTAAAPLVFNDKGQLISGSPIKLTQNYGPGDMTYTVDFGGMTQKAQAFAGGSVTARAAPPVIPTDPSTYTSSTSATVYDDQGVGHTLTYYFSKIALNTWEVQTSFDGAAPVVQPGFVTFDGTGKLTGGSSLAYTAPINAPSGATTPLAFTSYFTGTTQFGSPFGVNELTQDGYADGSITGLTIGKDGVIQGRYSNGQNRIIGQVVLYNFANPQGLQPLGDNRWASSFASGDGRSGAPGTSDFGALQSGAVEDANIDLTAELVNMITAQRSYQANAQTIKTQDQILQTLVNLR